MHSDLHTYLHTPIGKLPTGTVQQILQHLKTQNQSIIHSLIAYFVLNVYRNTPVELIKRIQKHLTNENEVLYGFQLIHWYNVTSRTQSVVEMLRRLHCTSSDTYIYRRNLLFLLRNRFNINSVVRLYAHSNYMHTKEWFHPLQLQIFMRIRYTFQTSTSICENSDYQCKNQLSLIAAELSTVFAQDPFILNLKINIHEAIFLNLFKVRALMCELLLPVTVISSFLLEYCNRYLQSESTIPWLTQAIGILQDNPVLYEVMSAKNLALRKEVPDAISPGLFADIMVIAYNRKDMSVIENVLVPHIDLVYRFMRVPNTRGLHCLYALYCEFQTSTSGQRNARWQFMHNLWLKFYNVFQDVLVRTSTSPVAFVHYLTNHVLLQTTCVICMDDFVFREYVVACTQCTTTRMHLRCARTIVRCPVCRQSGPRLSLLKSLIEESTS